MGTSESVAELSYKKCKQLIHNYFTVLTHKVLKKEHGNIRYK